MAILQALSLLTLLTVAAARCPSGFTMYANKACYLPVATRLSWGEAEEFCNQYSSCSSGKIGHLASVHTDGENDYLVTLYNMLQFPQAGQFWIGLNDIRLQGNFEWSDGWTYGPTQTPFTKFLLPPDARTIGDCVAVEGNRQAPPPQSAGTWSVRACNERREFVCIVEEALSTECPAPPITPTRPAV